MATTNTQPFELSQGETTTTTAGITAKQGNYNISASFARRADSEIQQVNVTVSFGALTATLNQYDAGQNLNYSLPATITQEQEVELRAIFAEALRQIKTR